MEIVATQFGDPDVLKAVHTEPRTPLKGEVAIQLRAIGVNHRDYKIYADPSYTRSRGQNLPIFPLRLGVEAAGVVTAVGPEAVGPAGPIIAGDEVIAYRIDGAYADEIVVSASQVVPKPDQLSWEQAATMMLDGTTAVHALAAVRIRRGETILLHAAAGGVGLAAVQLAVMGGIRVIGTASEKDFEMLRRYDVEPVEYGPGLLNRLNAVVPGGVDAALDFAGSDEAIDVSLELVRDRSRIATIVAFDRAKDVGIQAIGGAAGEDPSGLEVRKYARLRLTALVDAGAYDVIVGRVYPLSRAADAHWLLSKGGSGGRIALVP